MYAIQSVKVDKKFREVKITVTSPDISIENYALKAEIEEVLASLIGESGCNYLDRFYTSLGLVHNVVVHINFFNDCTHEQRRNFTLTVVRGISEHLYHEYSHTMYAVLMRKAETTELKELLTTLNSEGVPVLMPILDLREF